VSIIFVSQSPLHIQSLMKWYLISIFFYR